MKEMRRIIALVLSLMMVIGMVPVSAFAAEAEVEYLLFATDRHENESVIGNILTNVIENVGTVSYVGLGGDMVNDNNTSSTKWNSSTVLGEVTGVATNLSAENVDLVYASSHDMNCNDDAGIMNYESGLMYTGDTYYVYGVTQDDMGYNDASAAEEPAANFTDWANGLASDDDRVIIVLSHLPIHAQRGDNLGAGYWHNALNIAATGSANGGEIKRNVIFFHGHNHTTESNQEHFYAAGSNLSVESYVSVSDAAVAAASVGDALVSTVYDNEAQVYASSSGTSATIYYTYATAGYLNANSHATLVGISDSIVTLTKYDTSSYEAMGEVTRVVTEDTTEETTAPTTETTEATEPSTEATEPSTEATEPSTEATEPSVDITHIEVLGTTTYTVGDELTFTSVKGYAYSTEGTTTVEIDPADCEITCACVAHENCGTLENMMNTVASGTNNDYHQVTVSYDGLEATYMFTVDAADETNDENTGVSVSVSSVVSGVVTIAKDEEGDYSSLFDGSYAAYDITTATALQPGNKATVMLPIPDGVSNPVVYYVDDNGNATNMNASVSGENVVFTTTHFSTYVVGEDGTQIDAETTEIESFGQYVEGQEGVETTKTVYVLVDAPTLNDGKKYIIASSNVVGTGYVLADDFATTGLTIHDGTGITDSGNPYIETSNTSILWEYVSSGDYNTFQNQSGTYLSFAYADGTLTPSIVETPDHGWTYTADTDVLSSSFTFIFLPITCYLQMTNTDGEITWSMSTSSSDASPVYFYQEQTITTTTATESGTYTVDGNDVEQWAEEGDTVALSYETYFTVEGSTLPVAATLNGTAAFYDLSGDDDIGSVSSDGTFTFNANAVNGGTAKVRVIYTFELNGTTYVIWDTIAVTAKTPGYEIDITIDGESTESYSVKGVTNTTTLELGATVKHVTDTTSSEMPDAIVIWSIPESQQSIATIDANGLVTFKGVDGTVTVTAYYDTGDGNYIKDEITIVASVSTHITPEDGTDDFPEYPNEGAIRFDKHATAVGNFSQTGIAMVELSMTGVPYTAGSEIDVVLMLDMTGSMTTEIATDADGNAVDRVAVTKAAAKAFLSEIVKNEDGSYNGNRIAISYFNKSGVTTVTDMTYVTSDTQLAELESAIDGMETTSGGTPYIDGLSGAQSILSAAKTDGIGNDRTQYCVFMTDGCPTTYEGTSNTFSSASAIQGMFTGTSYDTRGDAYEYEKYSTEMKAAGVTVYSVGLGLNNTNNAWSGSTATQCFNAASILLNDISGPANEASQPDALGTSTQSKADSYFFSVDDADAAVAMTDVFSNIAQSIKQAATDVVVEDKISDEFTMNFSFPSGVTSTDTGMENFYIQVVGYTLDENKERTGDPAVLENFTFSDDGTAVTSHTVDGVVTCEGAACTHVTFTDGKVTKIEGTYFTYTSDSNGEILTWTADKLDTTELALQYFVYLEGSVGADVANQIAAGTYPTNEYATITYTNYLGNECRQEFPVPQMTWNGAQVTYVFYLVNEAGQPVNRAGRVVPFAEAVYVTDTYTTSITWNDAEQTESFDAQRLASELVPDVYELYDEGANYTIHVFETETGTNLNNHFLIEGTASVNTTYVFNAKSDAEKYSAPGYYAANATFNCKDYAVTDNGDGTYTYNGTEIQYTDEDGTYVYGTDELGTYTIVVRSGNEVDNNFDFANTTVAFAVVWKASLETDTVVIDYGLDVVVDVTLNDALASGVVGVRTDAPVVGQTTVVINSGTYDAAKALTADVYIDADGDADAVKELKVGTATVESLTSVRFSLDKTNGMQLNKPAIFYYESDCNFYDDDGVLQTESMYSSVTVIPATTVYYEDEYVTLKTYTVDAADADEDGDTTEYNETSGWDTSSVAATATQDVDRPGYDMISDVYDANNAYGYDSAYTSMSQYSMGSAAMVNVKSGKYATAEFEFYGTGFDIISLTDTTTGTIVVKVYNEAGTEVLAETVDTYYGYKYVDGEWVTTTENDPNALYQVPVLKIGDGVTTEELTYGKYKAVITATYVPFLDHTTADGYDFYLDAIRIYNPVAAGTVVGKDGEGTDAQDVTIEHIYAADGELLPSYQELRDIIITAETFDSLTTDTIAGIVFIDSNVSLTTVSDYTNYGPNNELYLAKGQAVTFSLNASAGVASGYAVDSVQIAMKAVDADGAVAELYNVASDGTVSNTITKTLSTSTDMYYDITALDNGAVVITNTGDGILSITNVKITAKSATSTASMDESGTDDSGIAVASVDETESSVATASVFSVSRSSTNAALLSMAPATEEEPEATEPETEATEPETEATEPETEATEPETEATEPETEPTEPEEEQKPSKPGKPAKPGNSNKPGNGNKNPIWDRFKDAVEFIFGWLLK